MHLAYDLYNAYFQKASFTKALNQEYPAVRELNFSQMPKL